MNNNELTVIEKHCKLCRIPESVAKVLVETKSGWGLCDVCIQQFNDSLLFESLIIQDKAGTKKSTPKEIVAYLDQYIVGQDDAKKSLALAAYQHYKKNDAKSKIRFSKANLLMLGPTGSGKTAMIEHLANFLGVPFIIYDSTQLTETGYIGDDIPDILAALYRKSGENLEAAQRGIVCLDEIDKLDAKPSNGRDIGGISVQRMLLKTLESSNVTFTKSGQRRGGSEDTIEFDTTNVLFLGSGAFSTLHEIIGRRVNKVNTSIGFAATVRGEDYKPTFSEVIDKLESEDLITYGLIPEFLGRFSNLTHTDVITQAVMKRILIEPVNSAYNQVKALLSIDKIDLVMSEEAFDEIAKKASANNTGARALMGILNATLKDVMFECPSDPLVTGISVDFIDGKFIIETTKEEGDIKDDNSDV